MPFFLLVRVRDRTVALAVLNEHASLPLPSAILLFSDPPQSIERERERERREGKFSHSAGMWCSYSGSQI